MILKSKLTYEPNELKFGTSGLRALVSEMTDLECYINTLGFVNFCKDKYPECKKLYIAGDLRDSTPRIIKAVAQAGIDGGLIITYIGLVPTPVLALQAFSDNAASVMVTGSHIPSDRNGIKYYKPNQELMKDDESELLGFVKKARDYCYDSDSEMFNNDGMLADPLSLDEDDLKSKDNFYSRLSPITNDKPLKGKKIAVYEQSAVGRDMLVELLKLAGAEVVSFGRSKKFIPVDTEGVSDEVKLVLKDFSSNNFVDAIVSTDGDSDRPLIADEKGDVWSGDLIGLVVAKELKAASCAYPVSANDMLDSNLKKNNTSVTKTKIGSPYVIAAMNDYSERDSVVGWEVNGGFLVGKNINYKSKKIPPLETRDAFLPILITLTVAAKNNKTVGGVFNELTPKRYSSAGLIDVESFDLMSRSLIKLSNEYKFIGELFDKSKGFGSVESVDKTDGVRIIFSNKDVAHIRGSGNAPQLRIYSTANTKVRAEEIVEMCIEEDGIFTELLNE